MQFIPILLITLILSGCNTQSDLDRLFNDYTQGVANILDEEWKSAIPDSPPPLPPQRLRTLATTEIREGLIEVLDLSVCNLLPLIAQKNSSLGKVAPPSQVLSYELRFYRTITDCLPLVLNDKNIDLAIKEKIQAIHRTKTDNLPAVLWNAFYTGEEIEQSLALNQPPIPLDQPEQSYHPALSTLELFNNLTNIATLNPETLEPIDTQTLEKHYESLYTAPLGVPLLKSLLLLEANLNNAAHIIENRLERRPLCFKDMRNPKADILKSIFTQQYALKVQPYLSKVDRLASRWYQLHQSTTGHLPVPSETSDYVAQVFQRDAEISLWNRYIRARDRHTKAWQRILNQCNLMPGNHD